MPARIPQLRIHKPSGRAFIELSGFRHYVGPAGSPEAQANYDRLLGQWLDRGRKPAPPPEPDAPAVDPAEITIAEVCDHFMQHARIHYRRADGSNTAEVDNFYYAIKQMLDVHGAEPAKSFGAKQVRKIRERMAAADASRSYCNSTVRRLRHVFRWGASEGLIPATIHVDISTVAAWKAWRCDARETAEVEPVADAAVDAIKPFVSRQVWALIELQRYTGARPGELLKLRPIDVDMKGAVWTFRPRQHKTAHRGAKRIICFGPNGQEVIREFLAGRPVTQPLFSPREAVAEQMTIRNKARYGRDNTTDTTHRNTERDGRITARTVQDTYTRVTYANAIRYACRRAFPPPADMTKKAELKAWQKEHHWSPNQLRHTAATEITRQYGVEAARIVLGHKSLSTTLLYAERDERRAVDIIASVG